MLTSQITTLGEKAESDITKEEATSFFESLEVLWQGVCAGIASGQGPQDA